MNKKVMLEQANSLLKIAKEKPEQFKELMKTFAGMDVAASEKPLKKETIATEMGLSQSEVKKDDMPHPANSPQDKAHDVAEQADSIPHAMKILDTPEKQKAMLAHLRTLHDPSQERSEENKEIGMAANDKGMTKTEVIAAAKAMIELAKKEPQKFEELTKAIAAPAPAPAVAMARPAAPKIPAPAAMLKPKVPGAASMRMSKEEIKADLAKPFQPRHAKKAMGVC